MLYNEDDVKKAVQATKRLLLKKLSVPAKMYEVHDTIKYYSELSNETFYQLVLEQNKLQE